MATSDIVYRLPFRESREYGTMVRSLGEGTYGAVKEYRSTNMGSVAIKQSLLYTETDLITMWFKSSPTYIEIACLMALRDSVDVIKILDIIHLEDRTILGIVLPLAKGYIEKRAFPEIDAVMPSIA